VQQLIDTLSQHGVDATTVEESGVVTVEVPCDAGEAECSELLSQIERLLAEEGLPFVPEEQQGRILIRPPAG
jgi:hypothetical protein